MTPLVERRSLGATGVVVALEHWLPALEALKAEGKVRVVGVTHYAHVSFADLARLIRGGHVEQVQLPLNFRDRAAEADMREYVRRLAGSRSSLTSHPRPTPGARGLGQARKRDRTAVFTPDKTSAIFPPCLSPLVLMSRSRKRSLAADEAPHLHDTVRLSADGLAKVLGDLEARVLQAVWDLGSPVPARAVYERVIDEHPVSPLTVITVLNKLVSKRILDREKQDELLHYSARMTEAEFVAHISRRVVEGILSFQPDAVAASMVDVLAQRDPARLAVLARLIKRRVREQSQGPSSHTLQAPQSEETSEGDARRVRGSRRGRGGER